MLNSFLKVIAKPEVFAALFGFFFFLAVCALELFKFFDNDIGIIITSLTWGVATLSLILFRNHVLNEN